MTEVKCISGGAEYVETELSARLSAGWEVISIETAIYQLQGNTVKETTAYLKKITN